jgi:hypothetical protein
MGHDPGTWRARLVQRVADDARRRQRGHGEQLPAPAVGATPAHPAPAPVQAAPPASQPGRMAAPALCRPGEAAATAAAAAARGADGGRPERDAGARGGGRGGGGGGRGRGGGLARRRDEARVAAAPRAEGLVLRPEPPVAGGR